MSSYGLLGPGYPCLSLFPLFHFRQFISLCTVNADLDILNLKSTSNFLVLLFCCLVGWLLLMLIISFWFVFLSLLLTLYCIGWNLLDFSIRIDMTTKTKIKEENTRNYIVPFLSIASFTDMLMLIIHCRAIPVPNRNCPAAWL